MFWRWVILTLGALVGQARAGDPTRRWFTIETPNFSISSYAPLEPVARRVAVVAERAHQVLVPLLDSVPSERTLILLLDETDSANGFANAVPRNQITLYATAPTASSGLADYDDWLYLLTAHEYTHVVHLDTIGGLAKIVNRVLGKTWAPNQIQPRWVIEGLATYAESRVSSGGRLRNTEFLALLRLQALDDRMLGLDEMSGFPRAVPRGNAAYLYGSHFLAYAFARLGEGVPARMSHAAARQPLPFGVNRQLSLAAGTTFESLYEEWRTHVRAEAVLTDEAVARAGRAAGRQVTDNGETNLSPMYASNGDLIWYANDGLATARLRRIPAGGTAYAARDIHVIDGLGAWTLLRDGSLLYEQTRVTKRELDFQDIFYWDASSDRTVRITYGARARDPAVSHDERTVAFTMNAPTGGAIGSAAIAPAAPITELWRGRNGEQASGPAWSPDGRALAFAVMRQGGARDIALLDIATRNVRWLTDDRALDSSPAWSRDGTTVFFDSDRTGIRNIFAVRVADGVTWQVTNVVGGASDPAVSPDGQRLAYHTLVATGTNVWELPLVPTRWRVAEPEINDRPLAPSIRDDSIDVPAPTPYRARRTLAPEAWTTALDLTSLGSTLSAQTAGNDIANLHSYALAATLDIDARDIGVGASYAYSGWWLPLRVAVARRRESRATATEGDNTVRVPGEQYSATVSATLPTEYRPGQTVSLSLDYDLDWSRNLEGTELPDPDPDDEVRRPLPTSDVAASLGVRLALGRTRSALYTTGPSSGLDGSIALRFEHPSLGASGRTVTLGWQGTGYAKLPWSRAGTVFGRLAGGIRAGDTGRVGSYSLGATPTQDVVRSLFDSTRFGSTGYLRGYAARTLTGSQYHLLNSELRQELYSVEQGLSTLPIFVKRLHTAALADVGAAFSGTPTSDNIRVSAGAALRLDLVLGYYVPGTLEIGVARGLADDGVWEPWLLLTGTL